MLYKLKVTKDGDIEITKKNNLSKVALTLKKRKLEKWYEEKQGKTLYSKKEISLKKAFEFINQEEKQCL